jgi:hypothetical protein
MRPTGFRMAGHNHSLHIDPSLGKYNGMLILTAQQHDNPSLTTNPYLNPAPFLLPTCLRGFDYTNTC